MGMLATLNWFSYQRKGSGEDHLRRLTRNVSNAPIEVRAFLAQTTIRMKDLLTLQPGDLITTDKESTEDVLVQVEGKKKFLAQVGQFRGKRAIRLTRILRQAEVPAETAVKGSKG
jgi:flagellar motor switch protein FliM